MPFDYETLKLIWWVFIGVLFIGFAITDGMDMGVGNLLPIIGGNDMQRRIMINTVGPHWDGNQVWFITAGGAIFAAWPMVYAAAFSGFYFAMLLVLFALFFRPLAFDYRSKLASTTWRKGWDWGLFIGSFVPPLVFGIAFGNLLLGVPFHLDEFMRPFYTGHFWELFHPFALLCGLVGVAMITLHGAIWLQLRTTGELSDHAARWVRYSGIATMALFVLGGIWLALGVDGYRIKEMKDAGEILSPLMKKVELAPGAWLDNYGRMPLTMLFPLMGLGGAALTIWLSQRNRPGAGFFTSALALAGIIMTAGISLFPFIMPSSTAPDASLTVWDATSSPLTLNVMFWAVVIFLPIIIGYTTWNYYKMWGKVTEEEIEGRFSAY
jgi:cytochrome d ubiquinol oxidase subunit II